MKKKKKKIHPFDKMANKVFNRIDKKLEKDLSDVKLSNRKKKINH